MIMVLRLTAPNGGAHQQLLMHGTCPSSTPSPSLQASFNHHSIELTHYRRLTMVALGMSLDMKSPMVSMIKVDKMTRMEMQSHVEQCYTRCLQRKGSMHHRPV